MGTKTRAVCFYEFGAPEEVARLEERELTDPQAGEVLVEVKVAPLNPADINFLEGKYGIRPALPAIPGNESSGIVRGVGSGVKGLKPGDQVIAPSRIGSWCEHYVTAAASLRKVPSEIPAEQACFLSVNAPTAWALLHEFAQLNAGDWVLQNAANSTVGRFIIQIAKQKGLKTLNVVRRAELVPELKALGADEVVMDKPPVSKQAAALTKGEEIRLAVNAVGGESARELAKSLARHGTLVTIGAMGREPLQIPNSLLIFKDIRFRGLWINEWIQAASPQKLDAMYEELARWMQEKKLSALIDKTFSLDDHLEALRGSEQAPRHGKVIFRMQAR